MSGSQFLNGGVAGRFQMSGGQVIDPYGAVFEAKGVNVDASQMGDANQILADFPSLNFIRLNVTSYQSPDAYSAFVNMMTSRGVVVELEDHSSSDGSNGGGGRGVAFTGVQLGNELNWYAALAQVYKSDPYVWFGTDNEPPAAGISPWQAQTYDAIRNTGNDSPIMIELPGGGWPDNQTVITYGMDPSAYAGMSNIIADVHLYGWSSHGVQDQATVNHSLTDMIGSAQTIPSLNGVVPVILGEYGPSTVGATPDSNAAQVIQAAQQSTETSGAIAYSWGWGTGADTLTDGQGNLTSYGQEVASWMASSVPASGAAASSQSDATVSTADAAAGATLGTGMSFIGGAASGTSGYGGIYAVPTAGNGILGFTSDILGTGGVLDFTTALAATDWNGAPANLQDYIGVTDTPQGAMISLAATFDGPGTAVATIPGATDLTVYTLLEHAWT